MAELYHSSKYTQKYSELYIYDSFWMPKYEYNNRILLKFIKDIGKGVWLDLFCGQGQYFKLVKNNKDIECIGMDLSKEQLRIAKRENKNIRFFQINLQRDEFISKINKVDLVTIMWGAYCYINVNTLENIFKQIFNSLNDNGIFYIEVIDPLMLEDFNYSSFASKNMTSVKLIRRDKNGIKWIYTDIAGEHELYSPYLNWIIRILNNIGFKTNNLCTIQTLCQVKALKKID